MTSRLLFVHSSDELYGSDRILLEVVDALVGQGPGGWNDAAKRGPGERRPSDIQATVWLPDDTLSGGQQLSRELRRRGIRVDHLPLPILRRNLKTARGALRCVGRSVTVRRSLARGRFDAVYCTTSACLPLAPLARSVGIGRVLLHVQEPWTGPDKRILRLLARFTTRQIAIARHVAVSTGLPASSLTVVPNAVARLRDVATAIDGDPDRPLVYVMASRWNPWKGHRTLLTAWELAGSPGLLRILGGPPLLGAAVDVPALVRELVSDPSTVDVVGEVADVAPWFADADAVLLPTDAPEGFGLVVIEAFRQRKTVIASRAGGPAEVVTDGVDGWLFENRDSRALAALLAGLNRDDLESAGARAQRTYETRYAPERFHQRIRGIVGAELGRTAVVEAKHPMALDLLRRTS